MTAKPYHHNPRGGFRNPEGSPNLQMRKRGLMRFIYRQMKKKKVPDLPEGHALDRSGVEAGITAGGNPSVTWLGHAAFIIRTGGKVILTDPYLAGSGRNAMCPLPSPQRNFPAPMSC